MDNETANLMQAITAFEKQLSGAGSPRRAKRKPNTEQAKLASEMAEVQRMLAGMGSFMDDVDTEAILEALPDEEVPGDDMEEGMDEDGLSYMEEDGLSYMNDYMGDYMNDYMGDYMDDSMDDDYDEPGMCASEADPSGIEEEITDDRFSEVSRDTGDDDIPDAQHTLEVAPTELSHVAGMKAASKRLDRLAQYIEEKVAAGEDKQWLKVAYRIDQMADGIDARIKAAQEAE